jgi:hypothetical protein
MTAKDRDYAADYAKRRNYFQSEEHRIDHRKRQKKWRENMSEENKEKIRAYNREYDKQRKAQRKMYVDKIKEHYGCMLCDGEYPAVVLDMHHLDPSTKESNIASLTLKGAAMDKLRAEVSKCIVLCANCHRLHHHAGLSLEGLETVDAYLEVNDPRPATLT